MASINTRVAIYLTHRPADGATPEVVCTVGGFVAANQIGGDDLQLILDTLDATGAFMGGGGAEGEYLLVKLDPAPSLVPPPIPPHVVPLLLSSFWPPR